MVGTPPREAHPLVPYSPRQVRGEVLLADARHQVELEDALGVGPVLAPAAAAVGLCASPLRASEVG